MDHFQLCIMSPDQRVPPETVIFKEHWNVHDLKKHLSKVYPGQPPVEKQRLIFSGRIMADDDKLAIIFGETPISRTVHLVVNQSGSGSTKEVKNISTEVINISDTQLREYQLQYFDYLREHYSRVFQQEILSPHPLQQEYLRALEAWRASSLSEVAQTPSNASQEVVANPPPAPAPPAPAPNALEALRRRLVQRLDNQMNPEAVGPGGGFDLIELAYALFRLCLVLAICMAYSSWEKILIVALIAVYFHWYNEDRRNNALHQLVERRRRNLEVATENQQLASADTPEQISNEPQGGSANEASSGPREETQPSRSISRFASVLRFVTVVSFRFLYTLLTSLVPEIPIQLE